MSIEAYLSSERVMNLTPGWLRRRLQAGREAKAIAAARRTRREGTQAACVAKYVPCYPAEPVVRPKRHRRGLKGRFRA